MVDHVSPISDRLLVSSAVHNVTILNHVSTQDAICYCGWLVVCVFWIFNLPVSYRYGG